MDSNPLNVIGDARGCSRDRYLRPGVRQVVCGFRALAGASDDGRTFVAEPDMPFLPLGLFLWGVTAQTMIQRVSAGSRVEVSLGYGELPGTSFASPWSFAEVSAAARRGELVNTVRELQLFEMSELFPGENLTLQLSGPCESGCFWGITYDSGGPRYSGKIEPEDQFARYRGQVIRHGLGGDRVDVEAVAPTVEGVTALLAVIAQRRGY
jgi:hypothetical protein